MININENHIQRRFDSSKNSDKFYLLMCNSSLSKKIKLKYSKVNWIDIPIQVRFKIMAGLK